MVRKGGKTTAKDTQRQATGTAPCPWATSPRAACVTGSSRSCPAAGVAAEALELVCGADYALQWLGAGD